MHWEIIYTNLPTSKLSRHEQMLVAMHVRCTSQKHHCYLHELYSHHSWAYVYQIDVGCVPQSPYLSYLTYLFTIQSSIQSVLGKDKGCCEIKIGGQGMLSMLE